MHIRKLMQVRSAVSRRSFLASVAGGAAALTLSGTAFAQPPYTGATDSDTGSNSDNAGYGRGGQHAVSDNDPTDPSGRGRQAPRQPSTGMTDRDAADRPGFGRGGSTGYSDNDSGPGADASGHGRHGRNAWTGYTNSDGYDRPGYGRNTAHTMSDGDSGAYADPPGNGRGNTRFRCTDSDSGGNADPGGQGRHCQPR